MHLVHKKPRSWRERWNLVSQDIDAVRVRPIVEDSAEKVEGSTFDGLLFEDVIRHELHAIFQETGDPFSACLYNVGEVLNYESEVREPLGQSNAHGTIGSANVDDRRFT